MTLCRSLWIFWSFGLIACDDSDSTATEAEGGEFSLPSCDKYAKEPDVRGFCYTVWASQIESQSEMEESCSRAGDWEGDWDCNRARV